MRKKIEPPQAEDIDAVGRPTFRTDAKLLRIMADDDPTLCAAVDAIAKTSTAKQNPDAEAVKKQLDEIAEGLERAAGEAVSSRSQ